MPITVQLANPGITLFDADQIRGAVGVYVFSLEDGYEPGELVIESGVYYQSQSSANKGNDPATDSGAHWLPVHIPLTSEWAAASITHVYSESPTGTVDGVNAVFGVAIAPASGTLRVYVRSQRLSPSQYTITTTVLTITDATYTPQSGDLFLVDYDH